MLQKGLEWKSKMLQDPFCQRLMLFDEHEDRFSVVLGDVLRLADLTACSSS